MTDEQKKLIAGYMGWKKAYLSNGYHNILYNRPVVFDLNDAGLVVKEMLKRGEWDYFLDYVETCTNKRSQEWSRQLIAWLYDPDNFFTAISRWLKEEKK